MNKILQPRGVRNQIPYQGQQEGSDPQRSEGAVMMWPVTQVWLEQGELGCDPLLASLQTNEVFSKKITLPSLWLMWRRGWSGRGEAAQ